MTIKELHAFFDEKIPRALSCDWDNDGLMVCADKNAEVHRVLVALDITAAVAERAIQEGYDLIVSHHPLIFRPLKAVAPGDAVVNKVIRLLISGVSAMSFHTRLDAVAGGVNDVLASSLGLSDITPFGKDGEEMGRIGTLAEPTSLRAFAERGMNLVEGGHFFTENLVCNRIRDLLLEADSTLTIDVINSYPAEFV